MVTPSVTKVIRRRRPKGWLLRQGHLVRPKNATSASNAKPAVKFVTHGGGSSLLNDRIDQRTRVGKAYTSYKAALVQHLGGEAAVTVPQRLLVDQAARLQLLVELAWAELRRKDAFSPDGAVAPAYEALIRSQRELRAVLEVLGLKRYEQSIPALADYIEEVTE